MAVIGTIRQRLGGLLIVVIAFAMLAFILMDFGGNKGGAVAQGQSFAKVNGEEISYAAFNEKLKANTSNYERNLVNSGQLQPGQSLSDEDKSSIQASTIEQVIGDKLKEKVYENLGIKVSKAEKNALLFDKDFQDSRITQSFSDETGQYSLETFKQYLQDLNFDDPNSGLTSAERKLQWSTFENAMYQEKLDSKYNNLLSKSTSVPTWMATALYNNETSVANIEYVYVPFAEMAEVTVTDSELKSFIGKNAKKYQQEESVSLKYIAYPIVPSSDDVNTVQSWMTDKFSNWQTAENDSLFIMASSETRWDPTYYTKAELANQFADSIFKSSEGSFFGPVKSGDKFTAYKLIDKKQIPDSIQVRHIQITGEGLSTQEEYLNLTDSLENLVIGEGVSLSSLVSQFSNDPEAATNGGDQGWVSYGELPYSNEAFFQMNEGATKLVFTQTGAFLFEVYNWGTTSTGVKVAELNRSIYASETTTNNIFAEASLYAGNNGSIDAFTANSEAVKDAKNITKSNNSILGVTGNAREIIRWAFNAEQGEVSNPLMVGENFVIGIVTGIYEKGIADLENVRANVEADLINEKKAETVKAKLSGSDLSAIAAANSKSVQTADNISFNNFALNGVGNEPKVAGMALGLALNTVSSPIVGNNGVFVVKTVSKTDAPAPTDLSNYKVRAFNYSSNIQSKVYDARKAAAKVKDNSFDFL